MGLVGRIGGWFRRFGRRLAESDEERLADETLEWAQGVTGCVRVANVPLRTPTRIAGIVSRITVVPSEGKQAIEAVITDGTGEVTASWMGRTSIPGVVLGTRLILEGVVADSRGHRRLVNPRYEFA
ncbi:MAG: DNA-binding protein [Actinobacteria bacterium]|nr:DNA-binding protein [Actinomycetota bacterium]